MANRKSTETVKAQAPRRSATAKSPEFERIKIGITLQRRWMEKGDRIAASRGVTLSFLLDQLITECLEPPTD